MLHLQRALQFGLAGQGVGQEAGRAGSGAAAGHQRRGPGRDEGEGEDEGRGRQQHPAQDWQAGGKHGTEGRGADAA